MPVNSIEEIRKLNYDILIKEAALEDAEQFINLMNKQYHRGKKTTYFHWMFFNNYIPSKLFAAYDKGKPIAFYGIQIHKLNIGVNCGHSIDILTDENYRKRGLFVLLENEVFKFANTFNAVSIAVLPNYSGMKAHNKLQTWRNISKVDTLEFDCKTKLLEPTNLGNNNNNKLILYEKNKEYRNWRFQLNPLYNYTYINISENIFTITKIFEDTQNKIKYGDIVDFKCDIFDTTMLYELFLKTCEHLLKENVKFITCWALPHVLLNPLLISMGFKSVPRERYFCIRILDPKFKYLYNINNWHLVQADAEIF